MRHRPPRFGAWPLPLYRQQKTERAFEQIAPVTKFRRLLEAGVSAQGARALARTSPAEPSALHARLAVLDATPPPPPTQELWRLRKGTRCLTCVAVHQPYRIGLRLLEGAHFRRTTLIRDQALTGPKARE